MVDYIQVKDAGKPKYLPVESDDTISLETLQSAFPRSCGLCFETENKCFIVRLHRGILYPPKQWWKFCYEPIFDDDYEDDYNYEDDYDDDDQAYYEQNNVHDPPEKEDINELYYNLLNGKNDDEVESDYDDEWQC